VTAAELPEVLLSRVEDAGLNASAPPQQRWLDGWLLRFSPGKAQRARCVNPVAEGRLPLAQKLALCRDFYREVALRLQIRITPFCRPVGLDDWLDGQGYQRFEDTRVMVCPVLPPAAPQTPPNDLQLVYSEPEAFAHIIGEFRGTSASGRQAHAERLRHSPVPYQGLVLRDGDGQVVACGQFALEADMVGLYDVFTAPEARGRGLSRRLCAHLLALAQQRGARLAYLQVDASNEAARAVYRRLGFSDAYAYHYRALPETGR
jgi:GNAT superfamily N-acetyltransferase